MRSQVAVATNEKTQLEHDIESLSTTQKELTEQIANSNLQLDQLLQTISESSDALQEADNELAEITTAKERLESRLVDQYQEMFLGGLPHRWGQTKIPRSILRVLNSELSSTPSNTRSVYLDAFSDSVEYLHRLEDGATDGARRKAYVDIREEFYSNCPNDERYSQVITEILATRSINESDTKFNDVGVIFEVLKEVESFCFGL